jgi:hypothetical protein
VASKDPKGSRRQVVRFTRGRLAGEFRTITISGCAQGPSDPTGVTEPTPPTETPAPVAAASEPRAASESNCGSRSDYNPAQAKLEGEEILADILAEQERIDRIREQQTDHPADLAIGSGQTVGMAVNLAQGILNLEQVGFFLRQGTPQALQALGLPSIPTLPAAPLPVLVIPQTLLEDLFILPPPTQG